MAPPCQGYQPRAPEATVLHRAVGEGLKGFLAETETESLGGLPGFVLSEFHRYLGCGDLRFGFVRVSCDSCDVEVRVGFSCKGRSICPSCTAKRAAVTAAHLVDDVLPHVPFRQWTLAFPRALKLALAIDSALLSAALQTFVKAIFALQRRRAKALGIQHPLPGALAAPSPLPRVGAGRRVPPRRRGLRAAATRR